MEETFGVVRVFTGDESRLHPNSFRAHIWSVSYDERPVRVDQTIASETHMLTVFRSIKGPLVIEWLAPGDKFNRTYFCDVTIAKLVQALYPGGVVLRRRKFSLHLDNARLHNSAGQLIFSTEKIHPIIALANFARCSTVRLRSFWSAEGKVQTLYHENV
jgi:hypothetical protein